MTQKTVLITGASTGIGHDCAHTLHKRGWNVVATARKDADIARLQGEGLQAVKLDYSKDASIQAAFDQTLALTGGRLDAVFNNGAYGQTGALEDISTDDLRAQFEANFFGWHTLTRLIVPVMRQQGAGRIVQCSSVLGFLAMPFRGPYTASKFALEGYSDTLRMEVEGDGIKVISVQPGPITSQFRANALHVFEKTVDAETSHHRQDYQRHLTRMRNQGKDQFELGADAVTDVVIKALEHPNPRLVYRVTTPTKVMAIAKRLLPARSFHSFLARAAKKGG